MPETPPASIDDYIARFPSEVAAVLTEVRRIVGETVPGSVETISYDIPTFDLGGRHLVHFAAWEKHFSVYPVPRSSALAAELEEYQHGKGTLRFPFDQPAPYGLIRRVVEALAEEANR